VRQRIVERQRAAGERLQFFADVDDVGEPVDFDREPLAIERVVEQRQPFAGAAARGGRALSAGARQVRDLAGDQRAHRDARPVLHREGVQVGETGIGPHRRQAVDARGGDGAVDGFERAVFGQGAHARMHRRALGATAAILPLHALDEHAQRRPCLAMDVVEQVLGPAVLATRDEPRLARALLLERPHEPPRHLPVETRGGGAEADRGGVLSVSAHRHRPAPRRHIRPRPSCGGNPHWRTRPSYASCPCASLVFRNARCRFARRSSFDVSVGAAFR
jgi:hypothetical protein